MNYALLIGTNGDKRTLVSSGKPVEIRREFKSLDANCGFELVEVIEKAIGRTRRKKFAKVAKPAAKKAAKQSD